MSPRPHRRERAFAALIILASSVLGALLLEGALRLATGDRYLDVDLRLKNEGLAYAPGQRQRWKRIEWDVDIAINSEGLRDREYPSEKNPPPAVVALGDSFTEGYGVNLQDTYAKRLETRLGPPWRVYNGGLQGRHPGTYAELYRAYFKKRKGVRLVTMGFALGDDIRFDPAAKPAGAAQAAGTTTRLDRHALAYPVKRFLCEHSVLYNFVRRPLKMSRGVQEKLLAWGVMRPPQPAEPPWMNSDWKPEWEATARLIANFRDELKAQGREFVLILIPMKEWVDPGLMRSYLVQTGIRADRVELHAFDRFLEEFCRKRGISFLNLTPLLKKEDFFVTDGHWNERGHEIAARELDRLIRERGLLRRR